MITLSFSLWEVAILLMGIAFIIGTIYLVKLFKSVSATLETTTKLIEDNRLVLQSIIANADEITKSSAKVADKASLMVNEIEHSVEFIKRDVIDPIATILAVFVKLFDLLKSKDLRRRKI